MKKFLSFFIISAITGGGYSYGQSNKKPKISYGVKAGINLASYRPDSYTRSEIKETGGKGHKERYLYDEDFFSRDLTAEMISILKN
ncbi:MAG TPA: hypothetical protein PLL71_03130 [Agriterribacter sp.]|nr:hypothetical protein [Agriterribacter sp.]HRQ49512.1 hypothetical protein [Agriterribacter sp.]